MIFDFSIVSTYAVTGGTATAYLAWHYGVSHSIAWPIWYYIYEYIADIYTYNWVEANANGSNFIIIAYILLQHVFFVVFLPIFLLVSPIASFIFASRCATELTPSTYCTTYY